MNKDSMHHTTDSRVVRPYRLGVALSGGGSRGIAHIGALQAIEEAGLRPDIMAGVSAGSIVAVLYAAGVKPRRMLDMFTDATVMDFTKLTWGKGGILNIDKFIRYITRALGQFQNLEDLRMPCYVGATNFDRGVPVEFHTGPIGPRIQASCSIPVAIPPVTIDGTVYVDGGVLRNLPAWTIRDKCETLIGINVSPVRHDDYSSTSIFDIAMRTYSLLAKSNQNLDMAVCDLVVVTQGLAHIKVFSLKDAEKTYATGYEHTRRALEERGWWHPDAGPDAGDDSISQLLNI